MADILAAYNINFGKRLKLYAVYVDNGLGSLIEEEKQKIKEFLKERKIEFTVMEDNSTKEIIEHRTKPMSPCFICTRESRQRLLTEAQKIGARKIALGHNLDDFIETLLLNIFGTGK